MAANNIQLGSTNPTMPNLVIDKIMQLLPTKACIHATFLSKQWQSVLCSVPVLDFDENDDLFFPRHKRTLTCYTDYVDYAHLVHKRFMRFLSGYLEYRENGDCKAPLDKLRLHMRMYGCGEDDSIINKWLELAFARGIKELDICLGLRVDTKVHGAGAWIHRCYCLSRSTFVNAKSLTSLQLDRMKITKAGIQSEGDHDHEHLLPSLKIMSLNMVWLDDKALPSLLSECPSLEHLSIINCAYENHQCHVPSSSLRSLEVKGCKKLEVLEVDDVAHTLESFTLHSFTSECQLVLNDTFNLKHVDICAYAIGQLLISGSHCTLEATINVHNLYSFQFHGHLMAQVCVKASQFGLIDIVVGELLNKKADFPTTINFLRGFGRCKRVFMENLDSEALVVPENFRKTSSSPLPDSCILVLETPNLPSKLSRDYLDLIDSLRWIAPSASISIKQVK